MAVLNANQIKAVKQRNEAELSRGSNGTHGYPANQIRDLLQTIEHMKSEKKKWKKLAQERGDDLDLIRTVLSRRNS